MKDSNCHSAIVHCPWANYSMTGTHRASLILKCKFNMVGPSPAPGNILTVGKCSVCPQSSAKTQYIGNFIALQHNRTLFPVHFLATKNSDSQLQKMSSILITDTLYWKPTTALQFRLRRNYPAENFVKDWNRYGSCIFGW